MQFLADDDPDIGPYQYCPLIAPVDKLPDMATARFVAADAIKTVFTAPPAVAEPQPAPIPEEKPEVSRRGFLRRLAGKRN
jgi:hypothetical protein